MAAASEIQLMKTSVRDFSLVYAEARYAGLSKLVKEIVGLPARDDFYLAVNDNGILSSYLDPNVLGQLMQIISTKNQENKDFSNNIYSQFDEVINQLKPYWLKEYLATNKELLDFIDLFVETVALGSWVIGLAVFAPDVSEEERNRAVKYREENDTFADYGDRLIKNTVKHLLPDLAGYEKYVSWIELKTSSTPTIKELAKRKTYYLYTENRLTTDQSLADFLNEHGLVLPTEEAPTETTELKGEIAYKGKATGKVRIILLKEKLDTIQDGEILVSSMTTPLFLPAMKKSAAFVTDEGGLLCHAAIVARELKKPCIVGTKTATEILKTGDMVEVDADNGIVRIL